MSKKTARDINSLKNFDFGKVPWVIAPQNTKEATLCDEELVAIGLILHLSTPRSTPESVWSVTSRMESISNRL